MVLLQKFDGATWTELPVEHMRKQFRLLRLPRYVALHVKRFTRNRFFLEKNPTIVTFPVKNLDLAPYVEGATGPLKYDLVSAVRHEGEPVGGKYIASVQSRVLGTWYDVDHLKVSETHPQKLSLCESYLLIYAQSEQP